MLEEVVSAVRYMWVWSIPIIVYTVSYIACLVPSKIVTEVAFVGVV